MAKAPVVDMSAANELEDEIFGIKPVALVAERPEIDPEALKALADRSDTVTRPRPVAVPAAVAAPTEPEPAGEFEAPQPPQALAVPAIPVKQRGKPGPKPKAKLPDAEEGEGTEYANLNMRLPKALKRRIEGQAFAHGRKLTAIITEAVNEWLERHYITPPQV